MSYSIKLELEAKRKIDMYLPKEYELTKNENQYKIDLHLLKYSYDEKGDYDKKIVGHIEIEVGESWQEFDLPEKYFCYSFLMRKLFIWDGIKFTNEPKKDVNKSFYLKFNNPLTNCFCQRMDYIINQGKPSMRSSKIRTDAFWEIPTEDKNIILGIKESV